MGLSDHYVASLKGAILSELSNVSIVDISHEVKPFDVSEAAYLLAACYKDFPKGTVHVIGVDSEPVVNFGGTDGAFPSIMMIRDQYFICNDNGFFGAFLKDQQPDSFWRIDDVLSNPKLFKFPTKNLLLPAGIKLLNGEKIESIASPFEGYRSAFSLTAISEQDLIKGHIVHIDNYGNAITNVNRDLFDQVGKKAPFVLLFKRASKHTRSDYYFDHIANAYNEVPPGEKVALFNDQGFIEIAINRGANNSTGGAAQLFALQKGDMIMIEFTPQGSRKTIDSLFNDH